MNKTKKMNKMLVVVDWCVAKTGCVTTADDM